MSNFKEEHNSIKYKQCKIEKNGTSDTVYIPEKFAIKNKTIRIKEDDGWKVLEVYEHIMDEKEVIERERDFTKTRKASDI